MGIRQKIPIGLAKDLLFQFFGVEKIFGDAKNLSREMLLPFI